MYVFTIFGTILYGGFINSAINWTDSHRSPPHDEVSGMNYLTNNFNDFPGGFVLLFEIIIINNW
jgi:hypothetical protein